MIHNLWHSITIHDSQPLAHHITPWFTTSGSALHTMTHNHWCVMLSQWLWIMGCYTEPVGVNYRELCWTSGCKSWCEILSKWLWITDSAQYNMISYHWLSITQYDSQSLTQHHDSQPLAMHNSPWFTTFGTASQSMIHSHWLIISHHDSQPLVQHYTPWLTTTGV
jgi:hypothetical protein